MCPKPALKADEPRNRQKVAVKMGLGLVPSSNTTPIYIDSVSLPWLCHRDRMRGDPNSFVTVQRSARLTSAQVHEPSPHTRF